MKNKKLVAAMKKRMALYAKGDKLNADGNKRYGECRYDSSAGGYKRHARANMILAEANKLNVDGDIIWADAVIAEFGPKEPISWSQHARFTYCIVRGETY